MALGFGFNKAKIMASAEKFVQQGKLPNAITEYEKVIKEDPKDLTVLNTIGDLYARLGQNDHATDYFKKVGDQYAQNGFTVKAIAIYKKLTKLGTYNAENITKLAELYSQQGLFNDARVHYMQVADHLLKSGDNNQAARVFQRILELDPENAATQAKLADLYQKLGRKDDARNIYYSAAESLYARGSLAAAEESLERVLALDPTNTGALLLRGMIAVDSGDSHSAVHYLEQVSNLDSRPDGLRALLRAKLHTGKADGVEAVASKLLTAHNDITGVATVAQWYVTNNQPENALVLYDKYADRLLTTSPSFVQETLYPLINRIKENASALTLMSRLLQKAGDSSHTAEIIELQAHASAKEGNYAEARDLYQKLAEMEPENALHAQNYRQMQTKLGEDPATRALTREEAAQALMVEELDETAPPVHQSYDPPTERAIEAALTDAELYVSYNVPAKAIPPLEAALPLAPQDVTLNQRLASLYARAGRYADAARICQNLSDIYTELGHPNESARYLDAAKRYALRAPAVPTPPPTPPPAPPRVVAPPAPVKAPPPPPFVPENVPMEVAPAEEAVSSVQEFSFDTPIPLVTESETFPEAPIAITPEIVAQQPEVSEMVVEPIHLDPVHVEPVTPPPPQATHEIDLSNEWEDMLAVEPTEAPARPPEITLAETGPVEVAPMESVPLVEEFQVSSAATEADAPVHGDELEPVAPPPPPEIDLATQIADRVQEIQFYISQEMWEPAKSAIGDLAEIAPNTPDVSDLIAAVSAGEAKTATPVHVDVPAPVVEPEVTAFVPEPEIPVTPVHEEIPAEIEVIPAALHVEETPLPVPEAEVVPEPPPLVVELPPVIEHIELPPEPVITPVVAPVEVPVVVPKTVEIPPPVAVAPPPPAPVQTAVPTEDEFVLELEPEPVHEAAPVAAPPVVAAPPPPAIVAPPPVIAPPLAMASSSDDVLDILDEPEVRPQPPVAAKVPSTEDILTDFVQDLEQSDLKDFIPKAPPEKSVSVVTAPAFEKHFNGDMQDAETSNALSDILSELQEETEEPSEAAEDPETHYNLGIAFKEMGLLDEAIGELQKVCHALDRGANFSQPIQALTWLAQCLVDKGAPEAAVRWYKKALQLPGLDDGSRCAIYYDLGMAFEASGDKKSALANFMEVYGSNIDYRDVASRIKALKS